MNHIGILMGGLDSAVLACTFARKGYRITPLYLHEGCRWEREELKALKRFLKVRPFPSRWTPLVNLEFPIAPIYGRHWSLSSHSPVPDARTPDSAVYLPGRNLGLATTAGLYCALHGIPRLALALLHHNPFRDSRRPFFSAVEDAVRQATGKRVSLLTPFATLPKSAIIRRGKSWPIHLTMSCLNPRNGTHCGRCNKCAERQKGFKLARVTDLTRYR